MNTTARTATKIAALSNLDLEALAAEAAGEPDKAREEIAKLEAGKIPGFVGLPSALLETMKASRLAAGERLAIEGPLALEEIARRRAAVLRGDGRRRVTYGRIH